MNNRFGGRDSSTLLRLGSIHTIAYARSLGAIIVPIENEISRPQHCGVLDMLRFLFSFCDTRGDATAVEPKDKELIVAFEMTRKLANKEDTPLR